MSQFSEMFCFKQSFSRSLKFPQLSPYICQFSGFETLPPSTLSKGGWHFNVKASIGKLPQRENTTKIVSFAAASKETLFNWRIYIFLQYHSTNPLLFKSLIVLSNIGFTLEDQMSCQYQNFNNKNTKYTIVLLRALKNIFVISSYNCPV